MHELHMLGQPRAFWLYAHKRVGDGDAAYAELHALVDEIERDFGQKILYQPVASTLDFQAGLLTELIPYVLKRASPAFGPLSGPNS